MRGELTEFYINVAAVNKRANIRQLAVSLSIFVLYIFIFNAVLTICHAGYVKLTR